MAATPQQTEAIKLIGDWSKWIATVETGAIAAVGAFFKTSSATVFSSWALSIAVLCFVCSIALAAGVLLSLPAVVQDIHEQGRVWDRPATLGPFSPRLVNLVMGQYLLFVLGIFAFGGGVLGFLLQR